MKLINRKNSLSAWVLTSVVCSAVGLSGCSESFLKPDPLSFFEPSTTFATESGLKADMATCDISIRNYWTNVGANSNSVVIGTEYMFSDLTVYGKSDVGGNSVNFNIADGLSPTGGASGPGGNDGNYINHYWEETYYGIKYANTILSYIDKVTSLNETTRNAYKGRALFHRAYRYLALVFQYGDVPLVTKLLEVPKENYRSTKKAAILDMITKDMENAVEWVPDQKDMNSVGMVNKGACRMLLTKCYLATGQFQKAKEQADILINQSGYALMTEPFGSWIPGGESQTWPITRNVIWDLHRCENKLIADNKEVIYGMPNRGAESHIDFAAMRIFTPLYNAGAGVLKSTDGKQAMTLYARNNGAYDAELDYGRALGRGIGTYRLTKFAQREMWVVNGVEDNIDLRHNSDVGNWVRMESLKYTTAGSEYRGQNLMLYADKDVMKPDAVPPYEDKDYVTKKGTILCIDTIRSWFDWPHYKVFINDAVNEANLGSNAYVGATTGSVADWYVYRLAEAYLLRAEANFYLGHPELAAKDVNELRKRAKCSQLYPENANFTIGDIMDERGRELYLEEWRHMELSRVSYCLALSGKPDEWGNTYNVDTYDKQRGTELDGESSYWYKRTVWNGGLYNRGGIVTNNRTLMYKIDKCNIYWPIPNKVIVANRLGQLSQNYGYTGYDANVPMWDNWQDAVADEDKTE